MKDRTLEAHESFDLINRMIANTRQSMERHAGRPFLVWGYTTVAITVAVWAALYFTHDGRWNFLWFALPAIGGATMWLTRRNPTEGCVHTYIDTIIKQVWLVMGLAALMISALSIFDVVRPSILFVILLLMGIGSTITGLMIRFKPTIIGGVLGIILAPITLSLSGSWLLGLFALGFVVMMILPGHILNHRARCQKTE